MFLISAIINDEPIDPALAQAQTAHQKRQGFGCHTNFPSFLLRLAETREQNQQQRLPEQKQLTLNEDDQSRETNPENLLTGCDRNNTPFTTPIATIDVQSEIIKDRDQTTANLTPDEPRPA